MGKSRVKYTSSNLVLMESPNPWYLNKSIVNAKKQKTTKQEEGEIFIESEISHGNKTNRPYRPNKDARFFWCILIIIFIIMVGYI